MDSSASLHKWGQLDAIILHAYRSDFNLFNFTIQSI